MNNLLISLEQDNYEFFCLQYTKYVEHDLDFSLDISHFESIEAAKAIKYIEFMLYKNPHNYNVSYIDYLIENDFSENLIAFVEAIKNNSTPQSIASEMIVADHIAFLVNKKKDDILFDYLMDKPVKDWSTYKSHQRLFNYFFMYDYEYSLDRFYSKKSNPHYYFIDYFATALVSEIEEKRYPHFEKLGIKDPKLLLDIIQSQAQGIFFNFKTEDPGKTRRSGFIAMKSRPGVPSKAKEIWLRYILESDLGEKTLEKTKASKI